MANLHPYDKRIINLPGVFPPCRSELKKITSWRLTRALNIIKEVYGNHPDDFLIRNTIENIKNEKAFRVNLKANNIKYNKKL